MWEFLMLGQIPGTGYTLTLQQTFLLALLACFVLLYIAEQRRYPLPAFSPLRLHPYDILRPGDLNLV